MNKETFKDKKGTFHCEPVVWGAWKIGDEVVFDGYNKGVETGGYEYTAGNTYSIGEDETGDVGPIDNSGSLACPKCFSNAFNFSRKVYDAVAIEEDSIKQEKSLDNLLKELHNLKQEEKAISNKIDNILNEINDVMKENGLAVVFTEKFDPHEYRAWQKFKIV